MVIITVVDCVNYLSVAKSTYFAFTFEQAIDPSRAMQGKRKRTTKSLLYTPSLDIFPLFRIKSKKKKNSGQN